MVELRKRASTSSATQPPAKRSNAKKTLAKPEQDFSTKDATGGETAEAIRRDSKPDAELDVVNRSISSKSKADVEGLKVGASIDIKTFGGEFGLTGSTETTTLKMLLDRSSKGVIIFTYPKASTPGCTKQACLFRDSYEDLTSSGYDVYGLSRDSIKANTNFKEKQKLQYDLLCDMSGELVKALGFHKSPKSTTRGVVAIEKAGGIHILTRGGPDATIEAVRPIMASG